MRSLDGDRELVASAQECGGATHTHTRTEAIIKIKTMNKVKRRYGKRILQTVIKLPLNHCIRQYAPPVFFDITFQSAHEREPAAIGGRFS